MMARLEGASCRLRLLDEPRHLVQAPVIERVLGALGGDDAVAARLLARDLHHRHDRAMGLLVGVDQLADAGSVADDDVVGQEDRERLVPDEVFGHQDGMPEPELLLLADVGDLRQIADVAHLAEHLDVALLLEQVLEFVRQVEVVLDGALLARGDDDDLLDARGNGLFHRVLDDRLVHQRQHLFGLRLGGGQEAGAPARSGENGLSNAHRTSSHRVGWVGQV